MKLRLDTHLLIWAAQGIEHIPLKIRPLLENLDNPLLFSAASIWEVTIKHALNRPDCQLDARMLRRGLLDNGYLELPITSEHALTVGTLPPLHKDPFDRLLIAQAITEGVMLLTNDAILAQYPGPVRHVTAA